MGLHFLGVFRIASSTARRGWRSRNHPAGPLGSYLMGLAFAFGWTPCIGPVLGTILAVAGTEADGRARAPALLAAYSLGLGIPFLVAGFFAGPFMHFMRRFRGHIAKVEKAMGALLVVTGVLFVTGQITTLLVLAARASSRRSAKSADRANHPNFGHDAALFGRRR